MFNVCSKELEIRDFTWPEKISAVQHFNIEFGKLNQNLVHTSTQTEKFTNISVKETIYWTENSKMQLIKRKS